MGRLWALGVTGKHSPFAGSGFPQVSNITPNEMPGIEYVSDRAALRTQAPDSKVAAIPQLFPACPFNGTQDSGQEPGKPSIGALSGVWHSLDGSSSHCNSSSNVGKPCLHPMFPFPRSVGSIIKES